MKVVLGSVGSRYQGVGCRVRLAGFRGCPGGAGGVRSHGSSSKPAS